MLRTSVTSTRAIVASILGGCLSGSLAAALSVAWCSSPSPRAAPALASGSGPGDWQAPSGALETELRLGRGTVSRDAGQPSTSGVPATASGSGLETEGPLPEWFERPLAGSTGLVEEAALSCARGHAVDCMRAGDAYEEGRGVDRDELKARLNRSAGARLFDTACRRREPDACYSLSVMYSLGQGVPSSSEAARGLMARTRQLCETTPAEICKRLSLPSKE